MSQEEEHQVAAVLERSNINRDSLLVDLQKAIWTIGKMILGTIIALGIGAIGTGVANHHTQIRLVETVETLSADMKMVNERVTILWDRQMRQERER